MRLMNKKSSASAHGSPLTMIGGQRSIWVGEFHREERLESQLRDGVYAALRSKGVTDVAHEDREQWIAEGTPTGERQVFGPRWGQGGHGP